MAVKWFAEEEHTAKARGLILSDTPLIAPDLIVAEVGNAFLKKIRRGEFSVPAFAEAVDALNLFLTIVPASRSFTRP